MSAIPLRNQVYGLPNPLSVENPITIVAKRAPTVNDFYPIGQLWVYPAAQDAYILTGIASNQANWEPISTSGGAGSFTSLTVTPGPVSLTGITTINSSGSAATNIGTSTYTGTVTIGNSTNGTVFLISPTMDIDSSAAGAVTIGDSITTGSISIGTGLTTGTLTIGHHSSTNAVDIASGSGGVSIISGGLFAADFLSDIVASPTATAVINGRQCYATFTGFTTASAASQVFTITNSLITTGSSIYATVNNLGSNDAQMTMMRVKPGAGTVDITCKNNGAAALNGDVNITLWIAD